MDFHTMVSNFRRRVIEERQEEIEELSIHSRQRIRKYIDQGTPGRHTPRYSFNHIFGDEETMRIAIPMGGEVRRSGTRMFKRIIGLGWQPAFTEKTVQQVLRRRVGDPPPGWSPGDDDPRPVEEYTVDKEIPDLQMKKDEETVIPKGPRAGEKITRTKKISLGKLLARIGTEEEKAWWQENQNSLREMENVKTYFLRPWLDDFTSIDKQPPMIVITRHPIDVARMSDFSMTRSCHSEGSSHFGCSIAESKGHGMVAYLITAEDWEDYDLEKRLNAEDEIFGDGDIQLDGPEPKGRVRIRKLFNSDSGAEFAVVEERIYGMDIPDFLPAVRKWARDTQKDIWADEEGGMKEDFVNDAHWVMVGGEFEDNPPEDLLSKMFEDTEWEDTAHDIFAGMDFHHEDYYGEGEENEMDEAETTLEQIREYANDAARYGSFYLNINEGWDGMPFYADGSYNLEFQFPMPKEWDDDPRRNLVPSEYRDSWQLRRHFEEVLEQAFTDLNIYADGEREWQYEESDDTKIAIRYTESVNAQTGPDGVEEIRSWVDEILRDVDSEYKKIKATLLFNLIDAEYLPPSVFHGAAKEIPSIEYENLKVEYDEDDPHEGILIKQKEDYIPVQSYDRLEKKYDLNIADRFIIRIRSGLIYNDAVSAKIRKRFKRLTKGIEKMAAKQIPLPFASGERSPDEIPAFPRYEFKIKYVWLNPEPARDPHNRPAPQHSKNIKMDIGIQFEIEIATDVYEEDYQMIKVFANFLDKNMDLLTDAAKYEADLAWKVAAAQAVLAHEAQMDTPTHEEWRPGMPTPGPVVRNARGERIDEVKLREAIRRAIKKSMLKEQTGFETRLFQVNLRLQLDPEAGGGVEQKLNRIRAIQGVTVVGHEEGEKVLGRRVIEAKVKFHPESDALRPGTFITQVLVPEINSSKHVPGVKVLDVIKGTLKRLDK
jgi:hypothetical protein